MNARGQRAAVLEGNGAVKVVQSRRPEPGAREVRVRLEGCGVCASNLPLWQGRAWFRYPCAAGAPGHEGWGRIDALGAQVRDLQIGERVAVISQHAYAQYDVAARAAVVPLPAALDGMPFPGEPLGCVMNIFERSDIRAGHSVAIVGAGFLGVLLVQLAVRSGAQVFVTSRRAYALAQARAAGAHETMSSDPPHAAIRRGLELTAGRGFDRVIEAAGEQSTLDIAGALAAERARLVIAGYHQDGRREVDLQAWNWRGLDVVNAHERSIERYAGGVAAAVDAVLDGRLDPFPLLTHSLPLESLDRAFALTADRPDGFMKASVRMEEA
ncbi:MAG: L-iditol 2-dehydrogenase [Proteobacteria bacterium]|nr:MAG: L-iditol 2-dehydrogenase [Pseudomonadota bacterium]